MIRDPLDVFLRDFSEEVPVLFEWTADEGDVSRSIPAIFDNAFTDAATGETILDTTAPRLTVKASAAEGIPREATTQIRGAFYSVLQIQPDGTGFAIITLAHDEP